MSRIALGTIANRSWLVAVWLAVSGCATVDPYASPPMLHNLQREDDVGYCARLFADVDRRIGSLGVRDAEAQRVAGFPYLRVDRFNAALGQRATGAAQEEAWRARLQRLDEAARAAELVNAALSIEDLPRCRGLLGAADAAAVGELRASAQVPDDYNIGMRAFGLYPLTRLPFAAGIARWHAQTRAAFATPIEALPIQGQLQRFGPPTSVSEPAPPLSLDPLGVPVFSAAQAAALFVRHAPMLEIDVAGGFDRIGALTLDANDQVIVDAAAPIVYTRLAHTLLEGLIHPQLVYTFWFSERLASSDGPFDLLAGKLDGVVWRVTLDLAGEALVYDSMHACGCHHLFFPTEKVVARDLPETLDETLFVPQAAPSARPGEKVVLRIESGTHYLQRLSMTSETPTADAVTYQLLDERALTTLPRRGGGSRSAYDPGGMIPGSERAERWFFWPMGIESAGQMRQWGRHATAFIGRRHFDDPFLFDAYFEVRR